MESRQVVEAGAGCVSGFPSPSSVLPHSGPAVLLDEILRFDAQGLLAVATVRHSPAFSSADGSLPAWVGLELMAQGVAAFSGCEAGKARLGLLLGARRYDASCDGFPVGMRLEIEVIPSNRDEDGFGVFDCSIRCAGERLAEAALTVYQPIDPEAFLREQIGVEAQ